MVDCGFEGRPQERKPVLVEHTHHVGEVPQNAVVTAVQAESALGRTVATELDEDVADAVDADTKEEEEALAGYQVNPSGVDYACVSWQPDAPGSVSAEAIGWEAERVSRHLGRADFACSASGMTTKLCNSLTELMNRFKAEL